MSVKKLRCSECGQPLIYASEILRASITGVILCKKCFEEKGS